MSDGIMLSIGDDGIARTYDDTYDITIHCESREEQEKVRKTLENIPRWIPCGERLPTAPKRLEDEERMFLVCVLNIDSSNPDEPPFPFVYKTIELDHYDGPEEGWREGNDKSETGDYETRVIAWMALPEPYEGEKAE